MLYFKSEISESYMDTLNHYQDEIRLWYSLSIIISTSLQFSTTIENVIYLVNKWNSECINFNFVKFLALFRYVHFELITG